MYKIIIVDDEVLIRRTLRNAVPWDALRLNLVATLSDGAAAIEYLRSNPCDIVLSDIKMPRASGLELAKYVQANMPGTRVILLSAYSEFALAQDAIRYGVKRYLLKPTEPDALYAALQETARELDDERAQACGSRERDAQLILRICAALSERAWDSEAARSLVEPLKAMPYRALLTAKDVQFPDPAIRRVSVTETFDLHLLPDEDAAFDASALRVRTDAQSFSNVADAVLRAFELRALSEGDGGDRANLLERVETYIGMNFASDLSLSFVAAEFSLSPGYLSHLFKRRTGDSFVRFLTRVRLDEAKKLLQNTNLPVSVVSRMTGYEDMRYFAKVFRREIGVTPTEFRTYHNT